MLEIHPHSRKDHSFLPGFNYNHDNPYHDKLEAYNDFVLRDSEAEELLGKWSSEVFSNDNKLNVEVGTGYGHFMLDYCAAHPHENFVGIDYRFKRSFNLARKLSEISNKNFRYLRAKGERLSYIFKQDEVDNIYYFFPDPWPKNRHKKKRLFQRPFLDSCYNVLKSGGTLYVKTDHDEYFDWMLKQIQDEDRFEVLLETRDLHSEYPEHLLSKFITKFEKIFLKQNIKTKALVLKSKK